MGWSELGRTAAMTTLFAMTLALAGCGGGVDSLDVLSASADKLDGDEATGFKKIGKPYKVGGKWYTPQHDETYDETGKASWYGSKFHGQSTANGEQFDQDALTAAHPTLPLPSFVRVTVVKTGKSAVLRVNDRGPFHRGRIIDVSKAAATKLGFRSAGSANVRVEYLGEAPIGGGDKETLLAEAKFGTASKAPARSGGGGFFGFGRNSNSDDERKVEVRLASAKPTSTDEKNQRALYPERTRPGDSNLPGVQLKNTYQPAMLAATSQPSAVQAYTSENQPTDGAVEALIAMNAASLEDDEPTIVKSTAGPLPEETVAASQSRVTGAFDVFGSASTGSTPAEAGSADDTATDTAALQAVTASE